jgi:hypothetical protein
MIYSKFRPAVTDLLNCLLIVICKIIGSRPGVGGGGYGSSCNIFDIMKRLDQCSLQPLVKHPENKHVVPGS